MIYLDDSTSDVDVLNNTCFGSTSGSLNVPALYGNSNANLRIRGNTFYNVQYGVFLNKFAAEQITNNRFEKNVVYADATAPVPANLMFAAGGASGATMQASYKKALSADSNYYRDQSSSFSHPFWGYGTGAGYGFQNVPDMNLSAWKTYINGEANSIALPTTTPDFQFNATKATVTYTFNGLSKKDAQGNVYNNSATLDPFTSKIFFANGAATAPLLVDAGTDIALSLPVDSTVLRGSATLPTVTYVWTKRSGPSQFIIKSPSSAQTVVDSLTVGRYVFQVKVTDQLNRVAIDSVVVTAQAGIVPVRLIDFNARKNNDNSNIVSWVTSSEENSSFFDIERGSNALQFQKIGRISSRNIVNLESTYSFSDNAPLNSNNYYRLRMVDRDGSFKYSPIALVARRNTPSIVVENITLTSGSGSLTMKFNSSENQEMSYVLYSANGAQLTARSVSLQQGNNTLTGNVTGLKPGVYFIKIISKNDTVTRSVLAID
jgi:hypothetical protein